MRRWPVVVGPAAAVGGFLSLKAVGVKHEFQPNMKEIPISGAPPAVTRPNRFHRPRAPVAAALLVCLLVTPPWKADAAEPMTATYRVHVGGVAVMDLTTRLELDDRSYRIEVTAQTGGFIGRLFPWQTVSRSDGSVTADRPVPAHHSQVSVFREKPRRVTLEYDARGDVTATVLPAPQDDDREPVSADLKRSTYDPLSGFLAMLRTTARGGGCTVTLPVFDGRRRYDMIFKDVGQRMVSASRYSIFSGSARQCRVSYRPVAGYTRSTPSGGFWQRDGDPSERPPVDLWLAPIVPDLPPLPVRMETDSDFGAVVVHLTGITPPGGTPALPASR